MFKYFPDIYGCIDRKTFRQKRNSALYSGSALKGRTRYTFKDEYPAYTFDCVINMTEAQFYGWQIFWSNLNMGADWFLIDLPLDNQTAEYNVHASGPFNAINVSPGYWDVTITLDGFKS